MVYCIVFSMDIYGFWQHYKELTWWINWLAGDQNIEIQL